MTNQTETVESKKRIDIAKKDIFKLFENFPIRVFKHSQIDKIVSENREFWRLAQSTTTHGFIKFLLKTKRLGAVKFQFPKRSFFRYIWGMAPKLEIILSLKPDSYFTHYTAIYLHNLTEQIPKTIYLNFEQPPKRFQQRDLEQGRIDAAFKRPVRVTNQIATYNNEKISVLNGMFTGKLGVIKKIGPEREEIFVSNVERTLIDITVRPIYSGGVFEVLKAYRLARPKVSINKLTAMLKKLNYIYPYHQAIGFYLEKTGVYKDSQINLIRKFDFKYDFYLTNQMGEFSYSKKWRLFYPKGF